MTAFSKLLAIRAFSLVGVLGQNVILIRFFSLDEIGVYYLLATVAYLGNAAVFVGADFNLQKVCASSLRNNGIFYSDLQDYFLKIGFAGGALVLAAAAVYFSIIGHANVVSIFLCAGLSIAMFLSNALKNLLQLSSQPVRSAYANLFEAIAKALIIAAVAGMGLRTAHSAIAASALAAVLTAAFSLVMLAPFCHAGRNHRYIKGVVDTTKKIAPVGISGIVNWAQLQGYRPYAAIAFGSETVGAVGFLTTLGSTAANTLFSVISQMNMSRLYASNGATAGKYIRDISVAALFSMIVIVPAGYCFLIAVNRTNLLPLAYLLVAGVLVEYGNAMLGLATNFANVLGLRLWFVSISSAMGFLVAVITLLAHRFFQSAELNIACALVFGQVACCVTAWVALSPPFRHWSLGPK